MFAAALKPRIDVLYLSAGLVSFRAIVDSEQFPGGGHVQPRGAADPFGSLLPGSLKHTGLPEIAASLAPRRLRLTGALDAAGFPLDPADLRAAYPAANAELKPAARRDAAALLDFLEM